MTRSACPPKPPSERDREIFGCVRISGHSQERVGRQYGLSQVRISQIVQRVAAWYAEHSPGMLVLADEAAGQRLALAEYRLRLDMAFNKALVAFEDSGQPLVTTRTRTTITKEAGVEVSRVEVEEKIERGQRRDTRAVVEMGKLAERILEAETGRPDVGGQSSEAAAVESAFERQQREAAERWRRPQKPVHRGVLSLVAANGCSEEAGPSDDWVAESYCEKNAESKSFSASEAEADCAWRLEPERQAKSA